MRRGARGPSEKRDPVIDEGGQGSAPATSSALAGVFVLMFCSDIATV